MVLFQVHLIKERNKNPQTLRNYQLCNFQYQSWIAEIIRDIQIIRDNYLLRLVKILLYFYFNQNNNLNAEANTKIQWCSNETDSSVTKSCLTLCNPMDCSMPGFPELAQTHVHWVGDAIQPSHPLSSPSPPTFNLSQHQGLFKWVSSSHQVAKVLEFQLQDQSFRWIFRTDFL